MSNVSRVCLGCVRAVKNRCLLLAHVVVVVILFINDKSLFHLQVFKIFDVLKSLTGKVCCEGILLGQL